MPHVLGILDAAEALYAVASTTLGVSLPTPTPRYESDTESEGYMSEGGRSGKSGKSGRSARSGLGSEGEDDEDASSQGTVREGGLDRIAAGLGAHVRGLTEVVEGLAGREGDAAAREMWGMLVFALQDWKDVL
jgi:hypothetical protein